jgi:hypothetical protein
MASEAPCPVSGLVNDVYDQEVNPKGRAAVVQASSSLSKASNASSTQEVRLWDRCPIDQAMHQVGGCGKSI